MRHKLYYFFAIILLLPQILHAQSTSAGGIDAVSISNKYYNSICKILLYDSAIAKTNPEKAYLGRGSGFFVSEDGYIFTNRHVIEMTYKGFCRYRTYNQEQKVYEDNMDVYSPGLLRDPNVDKITFVGRAAIIVQVFTNAKGDSSKLYHAQIVALDTSHFDGAILKITSDLDGHAVMDKFHPVPIGNSDSIKQGQDLCLFGFPAQYGGNFDVMLRDLSTLIIGKHSGYDFRYNVTFGYIKTDASISNGNSGGPAFGPSNNVIGIATAAFEKTNVGLIGGIDAMYYVSALIPDLQKDLTAKGFSPPHQKPAFITSTLYKPLPLPNVKDIKKANNMAGKTDNSAAKAYCIISAFYGLVANNNFYVPPGTDPVFSINSGHYTNVPSQEFGANIRIVKPTFLKQKNNLVGYFFNFAPTLYSPDWQNVKPVTPLSSLPPSQQPTITEQAQSITNCEPSLNVSFGFSYTYLFNKNVSISVYYGPGVNIAPIDDGAPQNNPNQTVAIANVTGNVYSGTTISYGRNVGAFMHTAGLLFKLHALSIGFDYHLMPNMSVYYLIPTPEQANTGQNTRTISGGTCVRSLISASLGVAL